jgi:lysophospholipase L1-like esterase
MKHAFRIAWLSLLLLPVLPAAANTALDPVPRSDEWVARHQAMAVRAQQGGIDLLLLGDSITDYWSRPDLAERFPGATAIYERTFGAYRAVNFGISGDRTQHVLWRLRNGIGEGYQPKVISLLIGTNNTGFERDRITPRNSTEETIEGVQAVVAELRARFPKAIILIWGLFPRADKDHPQRAQVAAVNAGIAPLHDGEHVFYQDIGARFLDADGNIPEAMMPDKLHPAAPGYEIWAAALREPLRRWLGTDE